MILTHFTRRQVSSSSVADLERFNTEPNRTFYVAADLDLELEPNPNLLR